MVCSYIAIDQGLANIIPGTILQHTGLTRVSEDQSCRRFTTRLWSLQRSLRKKFHQNTTHGTARRTVECRLHRSNVKIRRTGHGSYIQHILDFIYHQNLLLHISRYRRHSFEIRGQVHSFMYDTIITVRGSGLRLGLAIFTELGRLRNGKTGIEANDWMPGTSLDIIEALTKTW